jgi:Uma2 family endonuclease
VTSVEALITAEEFAGLPEPEEGGKMELVDGKVVCMPPVGDDHGDRAGRIHIPLWQFVSEHGLGAVRIESGFRLRLGPDLVRAPDVSFVRKERLDPDRDRSRYFEGPPTLAVEVVSPGDSEIEVSKKVGEYLVAGAERVWIVRPALRNVTVHRPDGNAHTYSLDDVLTSDDAGLAVDGFQLSLRQIFAPGL